MSPTDISPLDSSFTTQAALSSLSARPTNNIVNTNSFYDVVFLTASTGTIKKIEVMFLVGTTIPSSAFFNEAEGIGAGTASKSGQTITYTVTNAVSVPAGTKIRLEFANINNPLNPRELQQLSLLFIVNSSFHYLMVSNGLDKSAPPIVSAGPGSLVCSVISSKLSAGSLVITI